MSVNRYKPHVYVIPEDDADRQIANGFVLHRRVDNRRIQVVPAAGGWRRVLDVFETEYLRLLRTNQFTHVVLLIDFDGSPQDRRGECESRIPPQFRSRVFVVGPRDNPEALRRAMDFMTIEAIGRALADDCASKVEDHWGHDALRHNEDERQRLVVAVRPFLIN